MEALIELVERLLGPTGLFLLAGFGLGVVACRYIPAMAGRHDDRSEADRARLDAERSRLDAENRLLKERAEREHEQAEDLRRRTLQFRDEVRRTFAARFRERDEQHAETLAARELSFKKRAEAHELELQIKLEDADRRAAEFGVRIARTDALVAAALKVDESLWERAAPASAPPFRKLDAGCAPVVALLNLKGGVGKTTLTANLGVLLAAQGSRVLMVDLDFQGSLTSLCVDDKGLIELRTGRRFVDDVFRDPAGSTPEDFLARTRRVTAEHAAYVVAAQETLADGEEQAMLRWLLLPDGADPRFLLRRILHSPQVQKAFDFILLDCPPRFTTACVNALFAADSVMIPVIPDRTGTEAVPRLLGHLKALRSKLLPELTVLGVVADNAQRRGEGMIAVQENAWERLNGQCLDVWREPVHLFRTKVFYDSAFAGAATENRIASLRSGKLKDNLLELLAEFKERLRR